jgi:hypothetical protein
MRRYRMASTSFVVLSRLSFSLSSMGVWAGLQPVSPPNSTMRLA